MFESLIPDHLTMKKDIIKEMKRRAKMSDWEQFEIETADPMLFKIQRELGKKGKKK